MRLEQETKKRWEAGATERGYSSLAEFVKMCVESKISGPARPVLPVEEVRISPPIVVPRPIPPGTTIMPSGKKSYTPDFKGKLKKSRDM